MTDEPRGGDVYARFVADQVALHENYKASVEQRAMAVITSSSTLATLLFGLVALATRAADFRLPMASNIGLVISLGLFAVAAVAAILVNRPRDYAGVKVGPVREAIEKWSDTVESARQTVALTQLDFLQASKDQNGAKATWLVRAIGAEGLAVVALAIAMAFAVLP